MPRLSVLRFALATILIWGASVVRAEKIDASRGDRMIAEYFASESQKLADASLADIKSWDDFEARREQYRRELREMLGLDPLPERTPLKPIVTGKLEHPEFTVEKLHFQSRPGLYVTADLYVPKKLSQSLPLPPGEGRGEGESSKGNAPSPFPLPKGEGFNTPSKNLTDKAPGILYLCGHSKVKKDGVSLGNKTNYQHHGAWYARNGYVCLIIDTLQLGEIEGIHHGTYREGMWWWNARGYTPAGVEAWNAIRALDYLESRPEVDATRLGVTGRSGGGAYSWFVTALDDRIKAAVPVAGITNLWNHVVDGCVEGHCDCMYFVNTYRWDFDKLAALAAPRPLLISNTDQDRIFPLDGVVDVYNKTRRVYELAEARDRIGLQIAYGPHEDLQVLQVHAFQWFNHHLKGDHGPITMLAEDFFQPEELKVFNALPSDQINTRAHEVFVPAAPEPAVPNSIADWQKQRDAWIKALREKCFAGWPKELEESGEPPKTTLAFEAEVGHAQLRAYDFESQPGITLRLYLLLPTNVAPDKLSDVLLNPLDEELWRNDFAALQVDFADALKDESLPPPRTNYYAHVKTLLTRGYGIAYFAPRGIGPTIWKQPHHQIHLRRRFMLLGQTLDGMRVWDLRRAIQALRSIDGFEETPLWLFGRGQMSGIALYASLFEPNIERLELGKLANSHREGPDFLNVLRYLDVPQAVAMATERSYVRMHDIDAKDWEYPLSVAQKLGWQEQLEFDERGDKSE